MNKAYFFILLFLITACDEKPKEESVDFLESQPSEIKNSYTFQSVLLEKLFKPEMVKIRVRGLSGSMVKEQSQNGTSLSSL